MTQSWDKRCTRSFPPPPYQGPHPQLSRFLHPPTRGERGCRGHVSPHGRPPSTAAFPITPRHVGRARPIPLTTPRHTPATL
ncbi:hypothetical protein E2C01_019427 [Portunus trituberculatus]|uniref:Uncharacterized protein n=1 Tax=Portunus trituberculatus TaxID=210409 RepID=A0A5B7DX63_PORTR|nr:hypothetical protein [Portunus trituberculatus]